MQNNVRNIEKEIFRKKISGLAVEKEVGDAAFADAIYTATSRFGIEEDDFRDTFGLSKDAVERWTMLKNLPQPSVRPRILAWLAEQL